MKSSNIKHATVISFIIAFSTLAFQILFHRVISAKFLNNYAFLVISLTMLGFAGSGVMLSRSLRQWTNRIEEMILLWAGLFVLSSALIVIVFYHAPAGAVNFQDRSEFVLILLKTLPYALLFAVPFCFSGLILGILLSNPHLPVRRIYCWDLIGSACGATAVLPAIAHWGVERSLLAVGAALLVSVCIIIRPVRMASYGAPAVAAAVILFALFNQAYLFSLRYPEGTMLAKARKPNSDWTVEYTVWDPCARIEVSRIAPPDKLNFQCLIGENHAFHSRFQRMLTQNNFAFTYAVNYDGRPESLAGIEETMYAAAYIPQAVVHPSVAIVGVGGGFDVLTALHYESREITGIEVNGATLDILQNTYADYFRAWTRDSRVKLFHDEGRHFLSASNAFYDIIQISGVDSYSGTPGAAHVFSENYLYTLEAFEMYYSRLSENGILNIMRLEHRPPREMLRALTTTVAALRASGITEPAKHICMLSARQKNFVALLVKKSPFTVPDVTHLREWASSNAQIELIVAPGWTSSENNLYRTFLSLKNPEMELLVTDDNSYFDIAPTTDDAPFFFNFSRWNDLFSQNRFGRANVPVMEVTLIILGSLISIVTFAFVFWPLRFLPRTEKPPELMRYGAIFAGTALGYLAIEIALMQKFGLFLGHPNYALSIVFAGLLAATGIGALISPLLFSWFRGPRMVSATLCLLLLTELVFALPAIHRLHIDDFLPRALLVLALVLPLGILMGSFLPHAIERLKATAPTFVPWAWGVNGIFSVLAPILSIAFSMTWGIDALLMTAVPIYLAVGWCFPRAPGAFIAVTSS